MRRRLAAGRAWLKRFLKGNIATCRASARLRRASDIEAQEWSLNPGRYVGVAPGQAHDNELFRGETGGLQEELEKLNAEAAQLQVRIAQNVAELLDA